MAALVLLGTATASAAAVIDFTSQGGNGGGYGNSLSFGADGINVVAAGWGETGAENPAGSSFYLFETAEIYSWGTGLGICNRDEGVVSGGCSINEHEIDTLNRDDLLVLVFDQVVNFEYLTVDPYNGPGSDANDRDIIYWTGTVGAMPDLSTETFATLDQLAGFGAETQSAASSSYQPYTHELSGTGNVLLVAGDYHDLYCKKRNVKNDVECEAYKVSNIVVSVIPVPAAVWLFGSALGMLGWVRRRHVNR